jgi:hypothetical protein
LSQALSNYDAKAQKQLAVISDFSGARSQFLRKPWWSSSLATGNQQTGRTRQFRTAAGRQQICNNLVAGG